MNIIEKKEFSSLLITLMSAKMLLTFPVGLVKNSGNAAWLQIIFVTAIALVMFKITVAVYKKKINLIELIKMRTNKYVKIILGALVFAVILMNMISVVRIFPESIKIVLLQETSSDFIFVIFIVTIFLGARYGIESIVRVNYIFLPICGILTIVFILLLAPYFKVSNLMPILGNGAKNIFVKGINGLSIFSDIIILNILLAHSKSYKTAKDSGFRAILISGAIAAVIMLVYGLIYPYPISGEFVLPIYHLTRIIDLGNFFNRFEAVFQFAWSILMFLYGVTYLYILCFVWQITFNLKYWKPLLFPITLLIAGFSFIPESIMAANKLTTVLENTVYPFAFLLPIIVGIIDKVKGE